MYPKPEFIIRPKHWYQWINPFWWKKKKLIEAILEFVTNRPEFDAEFRKYIKDQYKIIGARIN